MAAFSVETFPETSLMKLEVIIQSNLRSGKVTVQQETVGAIEVVVVTDFAETESSSPMVGSHPGNTRLDCHSIVASVVKQTKITAKVEKQRELANSGGNVTNVRLKSQRVGFACDSFSKHIDLGLVETIASTKSYLPLVVDGITHLGSNRETGLILLNACAKAAADPNLSVCSENANEGKS